jgi:hypothetical protein
LVSIGVLPAIWLRMLLAVLPDGLRHDFDSIPCAGRVALGRGVVGPVLPDGHLKEMDKAVAVTERVVIDPGAPEVLRGQFICRCLGAWPMWTPACYL